MINFSRTDKYQHVTERSHTKIVSNETERGLAEDPISMQRTDQMKQPLLQEFHL